MKSTQPGPTLHKPIPMGTRVKPRSYLPGESGGWPEFRGTVVGIASCHIIYHYIVFIDEPIEVDGEKHHALSVPGTLLDSEDGKTNWRL